MRLGALLRGDGLRGRSLRGAIFTLVEVAGANVLRLLGNLVLTRLLFPEAFGIMALVQVVMMGLKMFSEIGIRMSIIQNARGDDPLFLDTAWTMQVGRGICLWLVTWALAAPLAAFYEIPLLAELLPVAGLAALFQGLTSTRLATANRHLLLGRVTALGLLSQVAGLGATIALAWAMQSVWALVLGGLVGPFTMMALSHLALPGHRNRLRFDPAAARSLVRFGTFIFLSTVAGFLVNQADRAILGKLVPLSDLALYHIAMMLAMVPVMVQRALTGKILFPLYSRRPPGESVENFRNLARARRLVVGGAFLLAAILAVGGDLLVTLLYDPRYEPAGGLLVLMAVAFLPVLMTAGYDMMVLARGNSRRFAAIAIVLAFLRVSLLFLGVLHFGAVGAALAPLFTSVLFYPVLVALIRPYGGWVPRQDLGFALAGIGIAALALWVNAEALRAAFAYFTTP